MGGAKNCPETPRQKMIGMMYLVLTAMLALNVSTNVLNAFKLVDDSLRVSLENTEEQNKASYDRLEGIYKDSPEKLKDGNWMERADSLREASDSLYNYIQNFKEAVHRMVDGDEVPDSLLTKEIENMSDFDKPGTYALVYTDPVTGRLNGVELRERIAAYRETLIKIRHAEAGQQRRPEQTEERYQHYLKVLERVRGEINKGFATDSMPDNSKTMQPWEHAVFEGMPVGACMAIMTKYQNDIRAYEGKTLTFFLNQVGKQDYKANYIQAYVIPKSSYVLKGGQFEAQIILAAVDTTDKPQYFVGDTQLGEDGIFRAPASSVGEHPFSGYVKYRKGRKYATAEFASEFTVGEPNTTIMNLDLNVIYRDYKNRYLISCPGMTDSQLKVSVVGATAKRSGKEWIIEPDATSKEVKVIVKADMNGTLQNMGEQTFRVKELPTPLPYLAEGDKHLPGDKVVRKTLNKNTTFEIGYGEDDVLKANFEVISFETWIMGKLAKSAGNKFSKDQLKQIGALKSKDQILFMNIKYRAAGGAEKKYPINYSVQLK